MDQNRFLRKLLDGVSLAVGYFLSFLFGLGFLYKFIRRWMRDPSNHFWEVKERELPPTCLNDPSLGNHCYVQIKNVRLHYVEKGDKSKPLMLCLHGFPEFWYSWRYQLKEFSQDYWVVAVDMRGYGDSEKPIGRDSYKMKHLVADVKHLILALGRERCTLLAHDWGGIIAWYFVLLNPHMVDSYVILNSGHPIAFRNVIRKRLSQCKKSWYVFFFQLPYLPELMCRMEDLHSMDVMFTSADNKSQSVTREDIEAFKFTFGKPGAFTGPINYYRANFMLEDRWDLKHCGEREDLPPGLVLFGEADLYINREIQEESSRLVRNTRVSYVSKANHFSQQDAPEAVNKAIREFFNQI